MAFWSVAGGSPGGRFCGRNALIRWLCAAAFYYNRRTPITHALRSPHSPR